VTLNHGRGWGVIDVVVHLCDVEVYQKDDRSWSGEKTKASLDERVGP
jgi:hypothetical protein